MSFVTCLVKEFFVHKAQNVRVDSVRAGHRRWQGKVAERGGLGALVSEAIEESRTSDLIQPERISTP